ncbi:hypothetical protein VA249_46010 (plasmid) [Vibrio alfacsensis]|nr:hypothetical protein VA249_46010 [Vibrio alfacsensis]
MLWIAILLPTVFIVYLFERTSGPTSFEWRGIKFQGKLSKFTLMVIVYLSLVLAINLF